MACTAPKPYPFPDTRLDINANPRTSPTNSFSSQASFSPQTTISPQVSRSNPSQPSNSLGFDGISRSPQDGRLGSWSNQGVANPSSWNASGSIGSGNGSVVGADGNGLFRDFNGQSQTQSQLISNFLKNQNQSGNQGGQNFGFGNGFGPTAQNGGMNPNFQPPVQAQGSQWSNSNSLPPPNFGMNQNGFGGNNGGIRRSLTDPNLGGNGRNLPFPYPSPSMREEQVQSQLMSSQANLVHLQPPNIPTSQSPVKSPLASFKSPVTNSSIPNSPLTFPQANQWLNAPYSNEDREKKKKMEEERERQRKMFMNLGGVFGVGNLGNGGGLNNGNGGNLNASGNGFNKNNKDINPALNEFSGMNGNLGGPLSPGQRFPSSNPNNTNGPNLFNSLPGGMKSSNSAPSFSSQPLTQNQVHPVQSYNSLPSLSQSFNPNPTNGSNSSSNFNAREKYFAERTSYDYTPEERAASLASQQGFTNGSGGATGNPNLKSVEVDASGNYYPTFWPNPSNGNGSLSSNPPPSVDSRQPTSQGGSTNDRSSHSWASQPPQTNHLPFPSGQQQQNYPYPSHTSLTPLPQVHTPPTQSQSPNGSNNSREALATALQLSAIGVGIGPGVNPSLGDPRDGRSNERPPIVNTGNAGPMCIQPGDWVCSSCGFVVSLEL